MSEISFTTRDFESTQQGNERIHALLIDGITGRTLEPDTEHWDAPIGQKVST
ncbi:hypothetical protein [Mycolicibacterium fortuitum]|uniref:hypothetical protein n=1 Tax=Mycolicibacterium fortuitum TaxID=1766 RepID=UPI001CDCF90F|nr:hypothetical protein [Mycolicibacterium fortuitum]UBV13049.1 hypothetical protein H8Z57_19455 [Mycolicibacterium fortuitum]